MKHLPLLFLCILGNHNLLWSKSEIHHQDEIEIEQKIYAPYPQDNRLAESIPMFDGERHMVIISCSYNNEGYYKWHLDSIFSQEYTNYHVIYVDDFSSDHTHDYTKKYINENEAEEHFIVIQNKERRRALANLYYAIHLCKPTDIILILDGDDRFSNSGVLKRINQAYSDQNIWLTYGQFREHPSGAVGFCQPYPERIIHRNGFRYYPATPSHLRTFYAALFHKIRRDDLMFQGDFFPMTYDLAIMFPMIEMARTHHTYLGDILIDYNGENPLNDHRVGKGIQRKYDLIIRARTCYNEIQSPF